MGTWFWIIAGINGSGKTTLARYLKAQHLLPPAELSKYFGERCEEPVLWLNPDERVKELLATAPHLDQGAADATAIRDIESQLDECIERGQTVVVETVLSSVKYQRRLERAHRNGMRTGMIYVALSSVEVAILRVCDRVARGGHSVPDDKIRSRWSRSLDNLSWFARRADYVAVYSNDKHDGPTRLAAVVVEGKVVRLDEDCLPEVTTRLNALSRDRWGAD